MRCSSCLRAQLVLAERDHFYRPGRQRRETSRPPRRQGRIQRDLRKPCHAHLPPKRPNTDRFQALTEPHRLRKRRNSIPRGAPDRNLSTARAGPQRACLQKSAGASGGLYSRPRPRQLRRRRARRKKRSGASCNWREGSCFPTEKPSKMGLPRINTRRGLRRHAMRTLRWRSGGFRNGRGGKPGASFRGLRRRQRR